MTVGTITLHEGDILDLDAVMRVMDDSFDPMFGEAWTAPQCAGLMPMPGVWLTLARSGSEIVGFSLARIVAKEAELLLLAVKQGSQRSGVGQTLLDGFVQVARSKGAERMHLEVRQGNQAINLYLKAGFSEVGRRRNYYTGRNGKLFDALTLAKKVNL
jgi:[ribosomal protein S18]-alanine N-acetyltransferase